jgi:hypothetical protein
LFDSVRGAGADKELSSNSTTAEGGNQSSNYGYLSSFDSDGFTATIGLIGANYFNQSGETYVNWNWLADNTSGSSNTDGSITSTVSANTTSGFSIVKFVGNSTAGATVGHGLGAEPKLIFVKALDQTYNWCVYCKSANSGNGQNGGFYLNLTDAFIIDTGFWNNTSANSSTFTLGSGFAVNNNNTNFIAYCFAEVKGFSKFGSYTGNGNADGTFVYTGFKPAFIMIKNTATATDWEMIDNKRLGYNDLNYRLFPNTNGAENTTDRIADILSNGFKIRNTSTAFNGSGNNIIYMAFAEEPLVGDNPATAR